jgi:arylsulfatase A-like enzyme
VYEGGIRTPLVATWPGAVPAGRVSYQPCHYMDVLPTLAELAGVPEAVPANVDGHSLVPELLGPDAAGRPQPEHEYLYWSLPRMNWEARRYAEDGLEQAVRAGDWKLLRHDEDEPWELYNLSTDPGETTDLADAKPAVRERLLGYVEAAAAESEPRPDPETPDGKRFR